MIPLDFELNKKERAQVLAILNELSNVLSKNPEAINDENSMSKFRDELSAIGNEARTRSLAYYASHTYELITYLQEEAEAIASITTSLDKAGVSQTIDDWLYRFNTLSPYLALLDNKERDNMLQYFGSVYENREKIYQVMQAQNNNSRIVKATTRIARELKFGTTKIERIVFERSEKTHFSNEAFYNCGDDNAPYDKAPELFIGGKKSREIFSYVSLQTEDLEKQGFHVPGISRIEAFDGEVLCSVISLYADENEYMTVEMIYRNMTGNKKDAKLHPQMRKAILASLSRLRLTRIIIYAEQEFAAGYTKKRRYDGVLLPSEIVEDETVYLNGREVRECIHIFRNSPLYDYADDKNQISRIPVAMLDVPVNNNKEMIVLKGYLCRWYADIRNTKNKLGNTIRYDTLFEYMGIEAGNRTQKKRIRDAVKTILEAWKKAKRIKDFQELDEDEKPVRIGKTIAKIKIIM